MAQAIEEGFILDVLSNYSTYDMFLRVKNTLDGEEPGSEIQRHHGRGRHQHCPLRAAAPGLPSRRRSAL
jgi:hypothetical protein